MRVWLISGGSLGHVLPAISFFYGLKELGARPILALEDKSVFRKVIERLNLNNDVYFFPSVPSPKRDFIGAIRVGLKEVGDRLKDMVDRNDRLVFFGSGLSLPFYWIALRRSLMSVVHEQNVAMGYWSAFLSATANLVFAGFASDKFPFYAKRKCIVCGNLVADFISGLDPAIGFQRRGMFKILVLGGTKGARALNYALPQILSDVKDEIEVIHICGEDEVSEVITRYNLLGFDRVQVVSWVFPVFTLMKQADLVVSRAGAMTLTEMALSAAPGVVVPYPYARGHQYENARFFADRADLPWVDQRRPDWQERLKSIILTLVGDRIKRMTLGHALRGVLVCGEGRPLDLLLS